MSRDDVAWTLAAFLTVQGLREHVSCRTIPTKRETGPDQHKEFIRLCNGVAVVPHGNPFRRSIHTWKRKEAMDKLDRFLIGALAAGVWSLVVLQMTPESRAQENIAVEQTVQDKVTVIHAKDIVGLSAMVQQSVRDHQFRPQSMPGLDQYVKSIVRNCRISGSVSGDRLTSTNISC